MGIFLISQSGTMGIVLENRISEMKNIELEKLVSIGNMAGVDFSDLITYANSDNNTDVILIYMEDVKHGQRFIETAQGVTKPIVVLKGGRSNAGSKAASSHTGAMAGSDIIYQAAFEQAGVILVDTIEELFIAAEVFSRCHIPKGNKVGIVSPGGGANISCVDFCERYGLVIPTFSDILQENILGYLPPTIMNAPNPVDFGASFDINKYHDVLYFMGTNSEIDILITNFVMTSEYVDEWNKVDNDFEKYYKNIRIPVLGSWMGTEGIARKLSEKQIPIFNEPSKAAFAVSLLVKQMEFLKVK